jgi:crotonobetainyl-CoA:carnitine CoA-transferase CaiB-like acyl-CoA transferase
MQLQGRVILDCSTLLPGPFVGKLLLQQGAKVIKIENPFRPDGAKAMGAYYDDLNEKKEIISLDLSGSRAGDRTRFESLVKKADGLIEGFRPHAKKKLGLQPETLHAINPKLCILSLVGYPEDGPWKDRAGHNLNFEAVTGCVSLFKEMPALPLADLFSAYQGALSLTSALDQVARGGNGTRIVVSMTETLKNIQSNLIREYQVTGLVPQPEGTLFSGKYPCYRLYSSQDGRRISVGAIEGKFWEKVCGILNLPHLIPEGYATGPRGAQVIQEIQSAFQSKSWEEWALAFDSADCCVEPVLDYSEVFNRGIQS